MKKKKRVRDQDGALVVKEMKYEFDGSCLLYMLLTAVATKTNKDNLNGIWNLVDQLADNDHHRDYSVWFLTDCLRVERKLVSGFERGQRMMSWSRNNKDLVASLRHASIPSS